MLASPAFILQQNPETAVKIRAWLCCSRQFRNSWWQEAPSWLSDQHLCVLERGCQRRRELWPWWRCQGTRGPACCPQPTAADGRGDPAPGDPREQPAGSGLCRPPRPPRALSSARPWPGPSPGPPRSSCWGTGQQTATRKPQPARLLPAPPRPARGCGSTTTAHRPSGSGETEQVLTDQVQWDISMNRCAQNQTGNFISTTCPLQDIS